MGLVKWGLGPPGSLPITCSLSPHPLGTPRGQDRGYAAQATPGPPDSQEPLTLASLRTLVNAHRCLGAPLGLCLAQQPGPG